MDIGLALSLSGTADGQRSEPATWQVLRRQAELAEQVGFDVLIAEDALTMPQPGSPTLGYLDADTVLGALAPVTSRVRLAHGVLNAPYRSPGVIARMAATLDEISSGRFELGLGAGNTPARDYEAFGIPADPRFGRFVETLEIVHALLRTGSATVEGTYWSARDAELIMRGPTPGGPPILVAAYGPRMMGLTARLADRWNWWVDRDGSAADLRPVLERLDDACEEVGRDPSTLGRTLDVYLDQVPGTPAADEALGDRLLSFGEVGVSEVRCYLHPFLEGCRTLDGRLELVERMRGVVEHVRAG